MTAHKENPCQVKPVSRPRVAATADTARLRRRRLGFTPEEEAWLDRTVENLPAMPSELGAQLRRIFGPLDKWPRGDEERAAS